MEMKANPESKALADPTTGAATALHEPFDYNENWTVQFKHDVAEVQLAQFDGHAVQFEADETYVDIHKMQDEVVLWA